MLSGGVLANTPADEPDGGQENAAVPKGYEQKRTGVFNAIDVGHTRDDKVQGDGRCGAQHTGGDETK